MTLIMAIVFAILFSLIVAAITGWFLFTVHHQRKSSLQGDDDKHILI